MDFTAFTQYLSSWGDIIREASAGPLALAALAILVVLTLAITLLRQAVQTSHLVIYVLALIVVMALAGPGVWQALQPVEEGGAQASVVEPMPELTTDTTPRSCTVSTNFHSIKVGASQRAACTSLRRGLTQVEYVLTIDIDPRCPSVNCGAVKGIMAFFQNGKRLEELGFGGPRRFDSPQTYRGETVITLEMNGPIDIVVTVNEAYSHPPPGSPIRPEYVTFSGPENAITFAAKP